jgi:hypothetical protein
MLALMHRRRRRRLENELELRSREFLIIAFAPCTAKLVRPSAFLGPRGVLAVVVTRTLLYASVPWLGPRLHRWALKLERERNAETERLSRELGRAPTDEELYRALAADGRSKRADPAAP